MRSFTVLAVGFFAVLAVARADEENKKDSGKDGRNVELTGTLQSGVVAIGGETIGTIIETKNGKFELDFSKKKELLQQVAKLKGKNVLVAGTLEIRRGVEVKERKIVSVTSLEEVKSK